MTNYHYKGEKRRRNDFAGQERKSMRIWLHEQAEIAKAMLRRDERLADWQKEVLSRCA